MAGYFLFEREVQYEPCTILYVQRQEDVRLFENMERVIRMRGRLPLRM
jgi:heme oxygenase